MTADHRISGRRAARILVGVTGASGAAYAVELLRRCPAEMYVVFSAWGEKVLRMETGLTPGDLAPHARRIYPDTDLAAPFASGSNLWDAMVVLPCSTSTLARIACGIGDTLLTRSAQVTLKERRRLVLCLRETPLSTLQLENAVRLSRDGAIIMPCAPGLYHRPATLEDCIAEFADRVAQTALDGFGVACARGWREKEL